MFKKKEIARITELAKKAFANKNKIIEELKDERDSYMEVMTDVVTDTNKLQKELDEVIKAHQIQTWKWEQAEQQLVEARRVMDKQQRAISDRRAKVLELERALLQSEKDFKDLLEEGIEDREVFISSFETIHNVMKNTAMFTDLPFLED